MSGPDVYKRQAGGLPLFKAGRCRSDGGERRGGEAQPLLPEDVYKRQDVVITEIGGTVGDIESQPFLEAIRQMKWQAGEENVM